METPDHVHREIEDLARDLGPEDEMGAVVRAHIRVESLVFRFVEALLPAPSHVKRRFEEMRPNSALHADAPGLSRPLHAQVPRQPAAQGAPWEAALDVVPFVIAVANWDTSHRAPPAGSAFPRFARSR